MANVYTDQMLMRYGHFEKYSKAHGISHMPNSSSSLVYYTFDIYFF